MPPIGRHALLILLCLFIAEDIMGQSRRRRQRKVDKSILIDLIIDGEFYPKSYFKKFDGEELTLNSEIDMLNGTFELHENSVLLDNFDYIKIIDKKKNTRNAILSGLVVGGASFFVAKTISKNEEMKNLTIINQEGANGNIEGILAGTLGFGLGLIFYENLFNKPLNITTQRSEIERRLKKIRL